jgi:hypothetical protein
MIGYKSMQTTKWLLLVYYYMPYLLLIACQGLDQIVYFAEVHAKTLIGYLR